MDIRVGSIARIADRGDSNRSPAAPVEAKLLAIRAPRRRGEKPPPGVERRDERNKNQDPAGGKVLVLMIPDGTRLPENLESGEYRVFLRFSKR